MAVAVSVVLAVVVVLVNLELQAVFYDHNILISGFRFQQWQRVSIPINSKGKFDGNSVACVATCYSGGSVCTTNSSVQWSIHRSLRRAS